MQKLRHIAQRHKRQIDSLHEYVGDLTSQLHHSNTIGRQLKGQVQQMAKLLVEPIIKEQIDYISRDPKIDLRDKIREALWRALPRMNDKEHLVFEVCVSKWSIMGAGDLVSDHLMNDALRHYTKMMRTKYDVRASVDFGVTPTSQSFDRVTITIPSYSYSFVLG